MGLVLRDFYISVNKFLYFLAANKIGHKVYIIMWQDQEKKLKLLKKN